VPGLFSSLNQQRGQAARPESKLYLKMKDSLLQLLQLRLDVADCLRAEEEEEAVGSHEQQERLAPSWKRVAIAHQVGLECTDQLCWLCVELAFWTTACWRGPARSDAMHFVECWPCSIHGAEPQNQES
jgi:hypothetical protein